MDLKIPEPLRSRLGQIRVFLERRRPPWMGRRFAIFLLSITAGLTAYWIGQLREAEMRMTIQQEVIKQEQLVEVVVANTRMPEGAVLSADVLAIRQLPQRWLGPDAIPADDLDRWIGKRLRYPLERGAPLLASSISRDGPGSAGFIPQGFRLVSLQADSVPAMPPGEQLLWADLWQLGGASIASPDLSGIVVISDSTQPTGALIAAGLRIIRNQAGQSGGYSVLAPESLVGRILSASANGRLAVAMRAEPMQSALVPVSRNKTSGIARGQTIEVMIHETGAGS